MDKVKRFLRKAAAAAASAAGVAGIAWLAWGQPAAKASADGRTAAGLVALTFDDGPNENTLPLLNTLRKHNIRATFFVVGRMAAARPDLIRQIREHGHELAGHTWSHNRLPSQSPYEIITELVKTRLLLKDLAGTNTYLYRPPGGRFNPEVEALAASCGYRAVMWNLWPKDQTEAVETIVRRVVSQARDGSVVLLHNGTANTIRALPEIARELRARGLEFATVSDLLNVGKAKECVHPRP